MAYRYGQRRHNRIPRRVWMLLVLLVVAVVVGVALARHVYYQDLDPVNNSQQTRLFKVEQGSTVKVIAADLERDHLIRSAWAFQLYVHSKELGSKLQAGTYALSSSQTTPDIVATLTKGKVTTRLVTILPGRRIDQVRADLINAGFKPDAVDRALNPALYSDLPVVAFKPAAVDTLEGLLWPDSYQKEPDTDPAIIIRESLTAMGAHLTPEVQAQFAAKGLSTYQGVTLASMIIQEVSKPTDQGLVAQVFLSRLRMGMSLGADSTARYGAVMGGESISNLNYDSPYNTLLHKGLPPGPISTISANSLYAATHPAATNWLYFVSGDNGNTYFSSTLQEHEALVQKYCHKLCGN